MKWKMPHKIKIYEALGTIADRRIELNNNTAKVYSSSRGKNYDVIFDPDTNSITSNDNGSYWQGYLGYPSIAFLMIKGIIRFQIDVTVLKEIHWKDINSKFENDFDKTTQYIDTQLINNGVDINRFHKDIDSITEQIEKLQLKKLGETTKPPEGY